MYRTGTYAAHLCTSAPCEDLGLQTVHEVVDLDAAFRPFVDPVVHADRAVLHVVVTDNENVRDLLQLGPADASAERLIGPARRGPETLALQTVGDAHGVCV